MRIDARYHIERAASGDETRPQMGAAYFQPGKGRIMATDGHIGAIVPALADPGDVDGPIGADALKAARKSKCPDGPTIAANGSLAVAGGPTFPRPWKAGEYAFPPLDEAIPAFRPGSDGTITIALDVDLLVSLAKALGVAKGHGVEITIRLPDGPTRPMLDALIVRPNSSDRDPIALGCLMPMRATSL